MGEAITHLELDGGLLLEMFDYYCDQNCEEGNYIDENQHISSHHLELVNAMLDSLEACLHEGVVNCFMSPALLVHPENSNIPSTVTESEKTIKIGTDQPYHNSITVHGGMLTQDVLVALREKQAIHEAAYSKLSCALKDCQEKKDSLFSMTPDDVQADCDYYDPYAYNDDYNYNYETEHQNWNEYTDQVSGNDNECRNVKLDWTEEEQQLYEWQCQQYTSESNAVNAATDVMSYYIDPSHWDDADDWVRHYDEDSGKHFYFSQALQESRWED